jgi:predicted ABC-type transport system involved in lysophospholipase L1 biosynthesis ATPase subunit
MNNTDTPILEARGVHRHFDLLRNRIDVLRGADLSVRAGESVAIMGASGAGKSTLLHIMGGLDEPTEGRVFFKGVDLFALSSARRTDLRARTMGFVFQAYHLLPELDITENVLLPAMRRLSWLSEAGRLRARALALLDQVGLKDRADHRPMELSGGEQQRVALARALMNEPEVVMADEPTGNLDSATGERVLHDLFALTREKGHTLVLVTHNEAVAARCERTVVIRDGRTSEDGRT